MVFIMLRNQEKNMVNDVRYYFIDICLCLHLENDEKNIASHMNKNINKNCVYCL